MEKEFRIKDILWYMIKRWYIFLVALALGVGGGLIYSYGVQGETARYQLVLEHANLTTLWNEGLLDLPPPQPQEDGNPDISFGMIALDVYNHLLSTPRANMLNDSVNRTWFLEDGDNRELVEALDIGNPRVFLNSNLTSWALGSTQIVITLTHSTRNEDRHESAITNLLIGYAEFIINIGLRNSSELNIIQQKRGDGIVMIHGQENEEGNSSIVNRVDTNTVARNLPTSLATGILVGLVLALITVLVWYYFDPKIKSLNEIKSYGFSNVVRINSGDNAHDKFVSLISNGLDQKNYLLAKFGTTSYSQLKEFALSLSKLKYKVLVIDTLAQNGNLISSLDGGLKLDESGDFDTLNFNTKDDWAYVVQHQEKFDSMTNNYNKVLIITDKDSDSLLPLTAIANNLICFVNISSTKAAEVKNLMINSSQKIEAASAVIFD